jgi:hypothetical protein
VVAFFVVEVAHGVEDGAVEDGEAVFDGLVAEGLGEVGLADAGRADEEDVAGLLDVVAGGELADLALGDGGVEAEVEVFEGFLVAEVGGFFSPVDLALSAHEEFVLEDQFKELLVGELVGGGFLEADFEGSESSGEAQLAEVGGQVCIHLVDLLDVCSTKGLPAMWP